MILTNDKGQMVLTPTYHVFRMYNVHQDATYLPLDITCKEMPVRDRRTIPMLSATASRDAAGKIHISMSNLDADNEQTVTINMPDVKATKAVGEILTAKDLAAHNTFEQPEAVKPAAFNGAKIAKGVLTVTLPASSIITLELQ
jgi:alpha-N-arabinofuranosidase